MNKKLNKEALTTVGLFTLLIIWLVQLLITNDIKNYVHPKFNKYLWFSIIVFIGVIIVNILFLKQKRHNAPIRKTVLLMGIITILIAFPTKEVISTRIETVQKITVSTTTDKYRNMDDMRVANQDYLKWYYDLNKNVNEYVDKTVTYNVKVVQQSERDFIGARNVMSCCAADIASMGIEVIYQNKNKFKTEDWVQVNGKIDKKFDAKFQTYVPYIKAISVKKINPLKNDLLYP